MGITEIDDTRQHKRYVYFAFAHIYLTQQVYSSCNAHTWIILSIYTVVYNSQHWKYKFTVQDFLGEG